MQTEIISASKKDLRNFGLLMGAAFPLFFGLLIPWIWDAAFPIWPWIVAAIFSVAGLAMPNLLSPIYTGWMKIALVLGWINTRILLSVIFYLIIFPIGLLFKIINKDPMRRKLDDKLTSYKIPSQQPKTDNLKRPF